MASTICSFIFHSRACRLDMGVLLALGAFQGYLHIQKGLSCPSVAYLLVHASFLYGLTVCEH